MALTLTIADDRAAIQAAAIALHDRHCTPGCGEDLTTYAQWIEDARVAYEAVVPIVQAAERRRIEAILAIYVEGLKEINQSAADAVGVVRDSIERW